MPKDKKPTAFEDETALLERITSSLDELNANLDEEDGDVEVSWQWSNDNTQLIVTSGTKRYLIVVCDLTGIGGMDAI